MIFWSQTHLDCLLWSSSLLEQTSGHRTYSIILFETRQRFIGVHVRDRLCPSLLEEWEWLRRLSSAVESQFCGQVAAEDKWGRSADH
jgi:hypothetical protein